MSTHQEKLDKYVDRSNRIIPNKIDGVNDSSKQTCEKAWEERLQEKKR